MRRRLLQLMGVAAVMTVVSVAVATLARQAPTTTAKAGAAVKTGPALKTMWGEPDLQGIWTVEFLTPLERPAEFAGKEFHTEAERAELDKQRAAASHFGDRVAPRGTDRTSAGHITRSSPRRGIRAAARR